MINRRHIRLKVMQSLYAYFTLKEKDSVKAQKQMLKQIESIIQLYFILLSLIPELAYFSNIFLEEQKNKHFPTDFDINPNEKFFQNKLVALILSDEKIKKQLKKASMIWHNNDHDLIRKLFIEIWQSDVYAQYINQSEERFSVDQSFVLAIFNDFVFEHKLVHHILEEESIYWLDDFPFVAQIICNQIRSSNKNSIFSEIKDVFKNKEDKEFAKQLLSRTILNHQEFENIIIENAKNWDLDRIAVMDQVLIKMALCELMYFNEIPVKVSLNEYIEVSKYYSTNKSKSFINGILDKVISDYKESGKIRKVGRGLLE